MIKYIKSGMFVVFLKDIGLHFVQTDIDFLKFFISLTTFLDKTNEEHSVYHTIYVT